MSEDAPQQKHPGGRPKGSKNKPKPNPLDGLSVRKRKYGMLHHSGMSKYQAAIEAGYEESYARNPSRIETEGYKLAFQQLIREKIPAKKIIRRIREGMDAVDTKFATQDGKFTDSRDVINWPERRKAAQLAAEMTGSWVPKSEMDTTQTIDEGTLRRLIDLSEKIFSNIPPDQMKELEASHVPLVINAEIADAGNE